MSSFVISFYFSFWRFSFSAVNADFMKARRDKDISSIVTAILAVALISRMAGSVKAVVVK